MKRASILLGFLLIASLCQAKGRRPSDDDADRFPDYNKLEYAKPIPKEPDAPPPAPVAKPNPDTSPNFAIEDRPLPMPKVGAPSNPSEPEFPTEMFETSGSTPSAVTPPPRHP